jgi:hypothetical protein
MNTANDENPFPGAAPCDRPEIRKVNDLIFSQPWAAELNAIIERRGLTGKEVAYLWMCFIDTFELARRSAKKGA